MRAKKSLTSRILSGIISDDDHREVLKGLKVGYMPQKSMGFRMSLEKNIMLNGNDKERAAELMKALSIEGLAKRRAHKLSSGETSRMAFARTLMNHYDLLILDEPTASMDMESTLLAERELLKYRDEENCAVVLITHSIQQAGRIADYVIFLNKGELKEEGPADTVLTAPQSDIFRQFLDFSAKLAIRQKADQEKG